MMELYVIRSNFFTLNSSLFFISIHCILKYIYFLSDSICCSYFCISLLLLRGALCITAWNAILMLQKYLYCAP
jgi:hypothetical protein